MSSCSNKWRHDDRCSYNTTGKNFSVFERHLNPQPLGYQCNALPAELSKSHGSGHVWVDPLCSVDIILGISIYIHGKKMSNSSDKWRHEDSNTGKMTWNHVQSLKIFSGHFSSSDTAAFTSVITCWLVSLIIVQGRVVQRGDDAIHRINHYPADSLVCFVNTYPLDSDLSSE